MARIDAGANQVGETIPLRHPPTGLAITPDGRTVWVATAADRTVHRIETTTGGGVDPIDLPETPTRRAYGDGAVWVTSTTGNAALRIIADTSKVNSQPIPVGNSPTGIAFVADRVWVANSKDGTVRHRPGTNEVGTRRLGFGRPCGGSGRALSRSGSAVTRLGLPSIVEVPSVREGYVRSRAFCLLMAHETPR